MKYNIFEKVGNIWVQSNNVTYCMSGYCEREIKRLKELHPTKIYTYMRDMT